MNDSKVYQCCICGSKDIQIRAWRAWLRAGSVWWNSHPDAKSHKKYATVYDLFFQNVFCNSYQDYREKKFTLFETLDCKKFLEEYFKIDLTFK